MTTTEPVSCNSDGDCYGLNLGWLVISFHILSFIFQSLAAITNFTGAILGYKYSDMVRSGRNPLRFIEYGFSASIMLIAIALLNGVTDINLITSISVLTSACQLCGLAVEYVKDIEIKWLLHLTGWLQFFWAYGIIGMAFFTSIDSNKSGAGPPNFVFIIVTVLFCLYSSFGFIQFTELLCLSNLDCLKHTCFKGRHKMNPFYKEMSYVILSLTAKLVLGWMIFSNVLVFSENS